MHGKGKVAIIDIEDMLALGMFKWYLSTNGYPVATIGGKRTYMHHYLWYTLMGLTMPPEHDDLDHIDRNKLNACKNNLRTVTRQDGNINRNIFKNNKSGARGVHYVKGKWKAQIQRGKMKKNLGSFATVEEASLAYETAAKAWAESRTA
jgi:hypothetical protein